MQSATSAVKNRIAFYASTPAYRPVLDLHGMGDLQPELTTLSKDGKWAEMTDLVPDELVDAVAITGTPEQVGRALPERWADIASAVSLYAPYDVDPDVWPIVVRVARGEL